MHMFRVFKPLPVRGWELYVNQDCVQRDITSDLLFDLFMCIMFVGVCLVDGNGLFAQSSGNRMLFSALPSNQKRKKKKKIKKNHRSVMTQAAMN